MMKSHGIKSNQYLPFIIIGISGLLSLLVYVILDMESLVYLLANFSLIQIMFMTLSQVFSLSGKQGVPDRIYLIYPVSKWLTGMNVIITLTIGLLVTFFLRTVQAI
jgi:hypothetical protein